MNSPEEQQESIVAQKAKDYAKKKGKALGKKALKKAAKVVAKAAVKVGFAIGKFLVTLLMGTAGPVILIVGGILLAIFVIYLAVSMIFSNSPESLEGEALELRNHIVQVADSTVDMSRPEQLPYRVPHELIIAALQLYNSGNVSQKEAASIMGKTLKPIFTYAELEGSIEAETTTCVNGSCSSSTTSTPFILEPLERVEAWDRIMEATFTPHTTEWQQGATQVSTTTRSVEKTDANGKVIPNEYAVETDVTTVTTKVRSHTFLIDEVVTEDYSHYDRMLATEPFSYGQDDRFIVEALYQATDKYINYTGWLTGNSLIGFDGTVNPGAGVPPEYMQYYLAAEKKYKVDWYYLAAIHFVETGYSTHPTMVSSVGAEGHMQFMPCTFVGWSYPACSGNGGANIPDSIKLNPGKIKDYGGYGTDANGDGKADPWDVADAIFTAANYLSKSGFSKNIDNAIWHYNHSSAYIEKVKKKAMELKNEAKYSGGGEIPQLAPGSFMRPAVGGVSSKYGPRNLKNGFHYGTDITNSIGTPIVAMADGKVIKYHTGCPQVGSLNSKCGGGWGNHVYIEHVVQGHKFVAVYAHFSKTMASNGQTVNQGQVIGLMGASGSVTGPHLHVELHKGSYKRPNNVLNPGLYIPF
ncbi:MULTISPECIES: peptidoglycan DD-metalloendopeptidase family protein [unclassified Psychrobacillus]|uniref:peptidoglycan DD-metalloendopeptidase family protein n=1 Tax=unclassified Psychrobacillus TaxID=2636677 RepID=UPI0030FC5365